MVVHRKAEEDAEKEEREPCLDDSTGLGAQDADAPAPLEDHHQHPVGSGHREQVQDESVLSLRERRAILKAIAEDESQSPAARVSALTLDSKLAGDLDERNSLKIENSASNIVDMKALLGRLTEEDDQLLEGKP